MEGGAVGHNFERDPPRDHPYQVWLFFYDEGPLYCASVIIA
jgi:hypothetical protein